MYGLLLRSLQGYLRATFGAAVWGRVLRQAGLPPDGFEPMLPYEATVLTQVLTTAAAVLERPVDSLLEDLGTFLVADPAHQALRRLLRFGGANFADFLMSLEELPDRARLAMPDLALPEMQLTHTSPGVYCLALEQSLPALFPIMLGAVRAMADDYGALVLIEPEPCGASEAAGRRLSVHILETAHGKGRGFALTARLSDAGEGRRNGW